MSAYVTYNGIPNGTSLTLGKGQYTFGSSASAQAVTVTIPADHDVSAQPTFDLTEGVIQVNGYGDPIGNHRFINPETGRDANFKAQAHKTYFGVIPDIRIPVSDGSSAIENIGEDFTGSDEPEGYYNLQGVRSETPWIGINIVKMKDGSVRKVIVK